MGNSTNDTLMRKKEYILSNGLTYLYQWDLDRYVICKANYIEWDGVDGRCESSNGRIAIPNILLQTAGEISGYAEYVDDDGQFTKQLISYHVMEREKPVDYVYTETEVITVQKMIDASVKVETERATKAESENASAIATETDRAKEVESSLIKALEAEIERAEAAEKADYDAVTAEAKRATTEEQAVRSLVAKETVRAGGVENTLSGEIEAETARAIAAEQLNSSAISAERDRAYNAESNIIKGLVSYSLVTETGRYIDLIMDTSTYKMKATLSNKAGTVISESTEIDLPIESLVINVEYDATQKAIIITLKDGSKKVVPVSDLISGLVNETTFNAEVTRAKGAESDLDDKITAEATRAKEAEATALHNVPTINCNIDSNGNLTLTNVKAE